MRRPPSRKNRLTFEQRLLRFPPILIRLLTKRGSGIQTWYPTDEQLADASGLPLSAVKAIGYALTWDEVPVGQMFRFLRACDIDLDKRRTFRRLEWLKNSGTFRELRRSPLWEQQFRAMAEYWLENDE